MIYIDVKPGKDNAKAEAKRDSGTFFFFFTCLSTVLRIGSGSWIGIGVGSKIKRGERGRRGGENWQVVWCSAGEGREGREGDGLLSERSV